MENLRPNDVFDLKLGQTLKVDGKIYTISRFIRVPRNGHGYKTDEITNSWDVIVMERDKTKEIGSISVFDLRHLAARRCVMIKEATC